MNCARDATFRCQKGNKSESKESPRGGAEVSKKCVEGGEEYAPDNRRNDQNAAPSCQVISFCGWTEGDTSGCVPLALGHPRDIVGVHIAEVCVRLVRPED